MPDRTLLTMAQVARRLGRTPDWFCRARAGLEAAHGFPASVAGLGRRWDPRAIDAWLDAQIPGGATAEAGDIDWENWARNRIPASVEVIE